MARVNNLSNFLTDVADAIRTKKETTEHIPAENFDQEILSIETGIDTSDATAVADNIEQGKTAYVNGQKIEGSLQVFGVPTDMASNVQYQENVMGNYLVSSAIKQQTGIIKQGTSISMQSEASKVASAIGLTADKLVKGNTVLGIEGTAETGGDYNTVLIEEVLSNLSVESAGTTYGFQQNADGTYSNVDINNNESAFCKFVFTALKNTTVKIKYKNDSELGYDYGVFGELDTELVGNDLVQYVSTKGQSTGEVSYNVTPGEHYIFIKYRKDSSTSSGTDSFYFTLPDTTVLTYVNAPIYYSKADMLADTSKDENTIGILYNDATSSMDSAYKFISGEWSLLQNFKLGNMAKLYTNKYDMYKDDNIELNDIALVYDKQHNNFVGVYYVNKTTNNRFFNVIDPSNFSYNTTSKILSIAANEKNFVASIFDDPKDFAVKLRNILMDTSDSAFARIDWTNLSRVELSGIYDSEANELLLYCCMASSGNITSIDGAKFVFNSSWVLQGMYNVWIDRIGKLLHYSLTDNTITVETVSVANSWQKPSWYKSSFVPTDFSITYNPSTDTCTYSRSISMYSIRRQSGSSATQIIPNNISQLGMQAQHAYVGAPTQLSSLTPSDLMQGKTVWTGSTNNDIVTGDGTIVNTILSLPETKNMMFGNLKNTGSFSYGVNGYASAIANTERDDILSYFKKADTIDNSDIMLISNLCEIANDTIKYVFNNNSYLLGTTLYSSDGSVLNSSIPNVANGSNAESDDIYVICDYGNYAYIANNGIIQSLNLTDGTLTNLYTLPDGITNIILTVFPINEKIIFGYSYTSTTKSGSYYPQYLTICEYDMATQELTTKYNFNASDSRYANSLADWDITICICDNSNNKLLVMCNRTKATSSDGGRGADFKAYYYTYDNDTFTQIYNTTDGKSRYDGTDNSHPIIYNNRPIKINYSSKQLKYYYIDAPYSSTGTILTLPQPILDFIGDYNCLMYAIPILDYTDRTRFVLCTIVNNITKFGVCHIDNNVVVMDTMLFTGKRGSMNSGYSFSCYSISNDGTFRTMDIPYPRYNNQFKYNNRFIYVGNKLGLHTHRGDDIDLMFDAYSYCEGTDDYNIIGIMKSGYLGILGYNNLPQPALTQNEYNTAIDTANEILGDTTE